MIKRYRGAIITFYICAVASLVFASFYDLKIDQLLNNPTDPFSLWFYGTGEMPARITLPLAGVIIFRYGKKAISRPLGLALLGVGSVWLGIHIADYFFVEENYEIFGAMFGIGIGLITLAISKYVKLPNNIEDSLVVLAYAGVIALIFEIASVEGTKYLWGRPRYRAMLAADDFSVFQPWYHINGNKFRALYEHSNEIKSCPSGHTAGAAISYLAMLLPFTNSWFKGKEKLCFIAAFGYSSIVAYTRLVMGAHFLSDVTIGAIFSFTIVVITMAVLDKKFSNRLEIK